jgi:hypothetical protein
MATAIATCTAHVTAVTAATDQGRIAARPDMKHFRQITSETCNRAVEILQREVKSQSNLWHEMTGRQKTIAVQRDTESIPLRAARRSGQDGRRTEDILQSEETRLARAFPATMRTLYILAAELGGTLERASYVRLLPFSSVYPHIDKGEYYARTDRYHLVIDSDGGSELMSGGETVAMKNGELWWFDNKQMHESKNDTPHGRIHLIFDIF